MKFIVSRRLAYSNNYIEGELISRFAEHVRTMYIYEHPTAPLLNLHDIAKVRVGMTAKRKL